jgi:hypothetical protein
MHFHLSELLTLLRGTSLRNTASIDFGVDMISFCVGVGEVEFLLQGWSRTCWNWTLCNLSLDKLNCFCRMVIVVNWGGGDLVSRVVTCLNVISVYLRVQEIIENLVHMWNLNHITPMCSVL